MKFLADENIGRSIVNYLRAAGHGVTWIKETAPGMADADILKLALKERQVIVTYDQDFGELVFLKCRKHYGVLLLRPRVDTTKNHLRIIKEFLARHSAGEIRDRFWKLDEKMFSR